jgi:2-dehydro-3-deoxyphosphogluconate aldolase/(4S)-4-hydroxy-2-oxoglutarate aldolase
MLLVSGGNASHHAEVGGPGYIRALKAPFPRADLITSGGVNQQDVDDFILAGSHALGIGEQLIPLNAVRDRKADWIQEPAGRFSAMVKRARGQKPG